MHCRLLPLVSWVMGMLCLRYMLGVCPAVMQDKPLVCECRKPFSLGQAMLYKCCWRSHV